MTEQRITILDASYSIFSAGSPASKPKPPPNDSTSNTNGNNNSKNPSSGSSPNPNSMDSLVMLQPIPDFKKVVSGIVARESGNGVFSIDVGLICGVDAVERVGKALHNKLVVEPVKPFTVGEKSTSS